MPSRLIAYWDNLRKDTRLPLFITAVMLFLTLFCLWQLTTAVFFSTKAQSTAATHESAAVRAMPHVAKFHLLGKYNERLADLPQTALPLNLEGIALSVNGGTTSRVLIASPGSPTKAYKVGDAVPGGAVIKQIFQDHIILNDNGRLESLTLPVPKISGTITEVNQP